MAELEARVERRIEDLETRLHESREEAWERSRERWRAARPDPKLTWGVEISGDAFVERAAEHGIFGPGRAIVEVGPGYGRLLAACLERGLEFGSYVGIDLSEENVAYLRERFRDDRVRFVHADVETVDLGEPVDAVISSLTFKHLFPSFEPAAKNLAGQLGRGGLIAFDLIEGRRRYFEDDGTYIRWYSRAEVGQIIARTGLDLEAFDQVRHLPELVRLLVVARKPVQ
jgi:SAM-dependent methyltransferase